MKILIADSFPATHAEMLKSNGHSINEQASLDDVTLVDAIADHDILIVRSTKVTGATLQAGSALKLVIRAGAGTNTIDKAAAANRDIRVCNVPGANSVAVAELVMGHIIAIDRNIPQNFADLKDSVWNKKKYSKAQGLHGQKIGILGLGAIGFAVAERARAFGMQVFAVSKPDRSAESRQRMTDTGIEEVSSTEALLGSCDIISLHLPATPETNQMVNQTFLEHMQEGAMLINTSRGELVDDAALLHAINTKGIRVGLDVYNSEPGAGDSTFTCQLAQHPAVCTTHHIGASTQQAQVAVADGVLAVVAAFENGEPLNCVN